MANQSRDALSGHPPFFHLAARHREMVLRGVISRCYGWDVSDPEWLLILRDQTLARRDPWVLLEGQTAVEAALAGWWDVAGVLIDETHPWQGPAWSGLEILRRHRIEFDGLAEFSRHGGVLGLAKQPRETREVAAFVDTLADDALLLVCPRLGDAGLAGELIQLARAHAAAGILFGSEGVSPFDARVIETSAGDVFRLPVRVADGGQILRCLKAAAVHLVGWEETAGTLDPLPVGGRRALVAGDPARGLGGFWRAACDSRTAGNFRELLPRLAGR